MRAALSFLTPFARSSVPTARTMAWFPLVGAAIGLAVGGLWWGAAHVLPAAVAAAVVVLGDAVLTGSLHLDGLTDAADGLLPPLERTRRLEVMRDPAVGAFGAVALGTVLLVRFAVFASVPPAPLVVAALWGTTRSAMVVASRALPYARAEGLASAFLTPDSSWAPTRSAALAVPAWAGLAGCVALAAVGRQLRGALCVLGAALAYGAVLGLARRRIGGFTGDVLGAAGVVGETVGLVVLSLRWS
jgi:adenosylcobinamide-GDP ribazoletransferase